MISATTCKYQSLKNHIDEILRIRDANNYDPKEAFNCIECEQTVRAHKVGERSMESDLIVKSNFENRMT